MIEFLDRHVDVEFLLGQHPHCLIAQIPTSLGRGEAGYVNVDPEGQWQQVRSVLDVVADGDSGLGKLHFLVFYEGCLPRSHLDQMLDDLEERSRPSTVTKFGLEHVPLRACWELLERFSDDNPEALERVQRDLYQGQHVYCFRCRPSFNFMVLVCVDYLYRDHYSSNAQRIIDHANQLYFGTRQTLDALFVIQSNPKPEHPAYRGILSGFYGEYLQDAPGVRDTVTVIGNCSEQSAIEGSSRGATFGRSSVTIGDEPRLARVTLSEFSTDDYGGAPLNRLRFGTATRLYYFNLPLHHERDPRSTRFPLKVHGVLRPTGCGGWVKLSGDEILHGPNLGDDTSRPVVVPRALRSKEVRSSHADQGGPATAPAAAR